MGAWEEAFSQENVQKAWRSIEVYPFNQCVLWDLREKEKRAAQVAALNEIDPQMLTAKNMIKIMFNLDDNPSSQQAEDGGENPTSKRRKRDTLHSCDLWDLAGGATGDECLSRIEAKKDAQEAKAKQVSSRKAARAKKAEGALALQLAQGAVIVETLTDESHLSKLLLAQLMSLLAFKAVKIPKGAKKPDHKLPCAAVPPPMPTIPEVDRATVADALGESESESGSDCSSAED